MTKRQLIDQIVMLNRTAMPSFLSQFDDENLDDYRQHLLAARRPRLTGNSRRFDKYFSQVRPAVSARAAVADEPAALELVAQVQDHIVVGAGDVPQGQYQADDDVAVAAQRPLFPALAEAASSDEDLASADIGGRFDSQVQDLHDEAPAAQASSVVEPAAQVVSIDAVEADEDEQFTQDDSTAETDETESTAAQYSYSFASDLASQTDLDDFEGSHAAEEPVAQDDSQGQPVAVGAAREDSDKDQENSDSWLF